MKGEITPNFLIVGASKSGTTSFAKYLNQHPEIYIPNSVKEPRYFVKEAINKISNWDPMSERIKKSAVLNKREYYDLFASSNRYKRCGEKSIHYFNHPDLAIKNIKNEIGDIPIIILLRNPVDRMVSNWKYLKYEIFDLETALEFENKRISYGYNSFWFYKYQSLYYQKVQMFKNSFTKVLVIIFEEFIKNPQDTLLNCINYLNITNFIFNVDKIHNPVRSLLYLEKEHTKYLSSKYSYFIFVKMLNKIDRISGYSGFMNKNDAPLNKNKYIEYFEDDIDKLQSLLNQEISVWLK